ncbi:MAG TPA: EamA family transporter RarD [Firmicutes bacterium]|jgi:chloramphenicol-sensitive protein RarD|nr:EamA family transporter RarD [Bacillota bacterium]
MNLQSQSTRNITTATVETTAVVGVWYAVGAFLAWGILPIYWKMLKQVTPLEILAHRFIWSLVFVVLILTISRRWSELKSLVLQPKKLLLAALCSVLVCANWGVYIWAVNSNHILDASLGYYINPLLSVCLGMLILRERLNFWQLVALLIAVTGVLFFTIVYGKIPWIALSLALTFGLYGLFKKMANIGAMTGLAIETTIMTPVALGYLFWLQRRGLAAFGNSPLWVTLLLVGAGVVTAVPMVWFARATQLVPLSVVGFTQYLTPTMTLILGVFLYQEPFTSVQFVGFSAIWLALALFSCSQLKFLCKWQPEKFRRLERVDIPATEEI